MAAMVRCVLAEVRTVPLLLVLLVFYSIQNVKMHRSMSDGYARQTDGRTAASRNDPTLVAAA